MEPVRKDSLLWHGCCNQGHSASLRGSCGLAGGTPEAMNATQYSASASLSTAWRGPCKNFSKARENETPAERLSRSPRTWRRRSHPRQHLQMQLVQGASRDLSSMVEQAVLQCLASSAFRIAEPGAVYRRSMLSLLRARCLTTIKALSLEFQLGARPFGEVGDHLRPAVSVRDAELPQARSLRARKVSVGLSVATLVNYSCMLLCFLPVTFMGQAAT